MTRVKEPVGVFLVMESFELPDKKPVIRNVIDTQNLFYVEFETILQDFLRVNRNKRFYPGRLMVPAFRAPHILELLANESFCMEAGHPDSEEIRRCLTIDPKNVCSTVLSMDVNERYNRGVVRTIDDGNGYGKKMTKMILQGLIPAFSLRALSKLKARPDGTSEVVSIPHVVCYDWVFVPSHNEAYMDKTKPVKVIDRNPYTGQQTVSALVKPVTESNVQDIALYVQEESSNVKIAANALSLCKESLIVTDDYKFAVVKEGSETYHIPLESYIERDITHYMKNL